MKAGLDKHDEAWFLRWFRAWAQRTGISRDPDDPNSKYDFRKAYLDRASPTWDEETKKYTWPIEYKIDDTPKFNISITVNGETVKADGV